MRDAEIAAKDARIKELEAKFAEVQSLYDAMHKLSTIEGAMKAEAYVKMLEAAFLEAYVDTVLIEHPAKTLEYADQMARAALEELRRNGS